MSPSNLRTVSAVVLVIMVLVATVVAMQFATKPHGQIMSEENIPAPDFEILPDRIVARVTANEILHPATTTPQNPDAPYSNWFYSESLPLDSDVIISGFAVEMENAPFDSLHHAQVRVDNRPATLCTIYYLNTNSHYELFTVSRHTPNLVLIPDPYGLLVKKGESLSIEFMTHPLSSPHGPHVAEQPITPTLKVTMFTDMERTVSARYLRLRLDDSPCEDPAPHQAFVVPTSTELFVKKSDLVGGSARYTFLKPGNIIMAGGMFWPTKGGKNVTAYLNDSAFDLVEAVPGDTEYQWYIPHKNLDMDFVAGDSITMSATYQNPFTTPIKDGSGMYGFYYTYNEPIVRSDTSTTTNE